MNNRKLFAIIALLSIVTGILFTSCSKQPQDLESYLQKDEDAMQQIKEVSESSGLDVDISGNTVTYTYDISNVEGVTEEIAKDELMEKSLTNALDNSVENFQDLCKDLEEESGISGISITVIYKYKDTEIVSRKFTSAGDAGTSDDSSTEEGGEESSD